MKLNMKARDWFVLVGGTAVSYLAFRTLWWSTRLKLPAQPRPQGSLPAGAPPPPPPAQPQPITSAQFPLAAGRTYFASLSVGFPASMGASKSKIASLANDHGFTNVGVDDAKPPWWPGSANGDYYVSGLYQGAPQNVERHLGPGVDIVEAFVL